MEWTTVDRHLRVHLELPELAARARPFEADGVLLAVHFPSPDSVLLPAGPPHMPKSIHGEPVGDVAAVGSAIEMRGHAVSAEVPAEDIRLMPCLGCAWESHPHGGHNGQHDDSFHALLLWAVKEDDPMGREATGARRPQPVNVTGMLGGGRIELVEPCL